MPHGCTLTHFRYGGRTDVLTLDMVPHGRTHLHFRFIDLDVQKNVLTLDLDTRCTDVLT